MPPPSDSGSAPDPAQAPERARVWGPVRGLCYALTRLVMYPIMLMFVLAGAVFFLVGMLLPSPPRRWKRSPRKKRTRSAASPADRSSASPSDEAHTPTTNNDIDPDQDAGTEPDPIATSRTPEELRGDLDALIDKHGLPELRDRIHAAAEPCISLYDSYNALTLGEVEDAVRRLGPALPLSPDLADSADAFQVHLQRTLPRGATRLGFVPDLPPDLDWPGHEGKLLPLIAQIDLAALPAFDGNPLPRQGWLYVFVGGSVGEHVSVHYHAGPADTLARQGRPHKSRMIDNWPGRVAAYDLVLISEARLGLSLPHSGEADPRQPALTDPELERLAALTDSLHRHHGPSKRRHPAAQLLGHVSFSEASPNEAATNAGRPGDDWLNLLEVHSVGSMCWSDAGTLNVFVRRSDLQRGDFSHAIASIASS